MEEGIQVSDRLKEALKKRRNDSRMSYEDIIWEMLEDSSDLSDEVKQEIEISRSEAKKGETKNWDEIKKDLSLNV